MVCSRCLGAVAREVAQDVPAAEWVHVRWYRDKETGEWVAVYQRKTHSVTRPRPKSEGGS